MIFSTLKHLQGWVNCIKAASALSGCCCCCFFIPCLSLTHKKGKRVESERENRCCVCVGVRESETLSEATGCEKKFVCERLPNSAFVA